MELIIKKPKEIKIIPECLAGEDNPPTFIFKEPNAVDMLNMMMYQDLNSLINNCFLRFENKPIIKDEKNNEINFNSYKQFIELGFSPILTEIHAEVIMKFNFIIEEISKEAKKTQKKLK